MDTVEDPKEFFAQHHHAYKVSPRHARGQDLATLVDGLLPKPGQRALDVATGAGHTAIHLAERGMQVTASDITPQMLEEAHNLAKERGLNIKTVEAPAEALPFADGSFDRITSRRAPHHFRDIAQFLHEAWRVLAPEGWLGISDMTGSQAAVAWLNHLERLRDPSHHRALSLDEWYQAVMEAHFQEITLKVSEEPMDILEWLAPVNKESAAGQAALQFFQAGGAPREFLRNPQFIKRRILIWAKKPT